MAYGQKYQTWLSDFLKHNTGKKKKKNQTMKWIVFADTFCTLGNKLHSFDELCILDGLK